MKIKKIDTSIPLKVVAQACTNMCEETVWAGKTSEKSFKGGIRHED